MIKFIALFFFLISPLCHSGERFNTNKLINLAGKNNELAADEGYLLLSIDNNNFIAQLQIRPRISGKKIKFSEVGAGKNFALIKLKAGEYYWDRFKYYINYASLVYNFNEEDGQIFKVEAGVVNYPRSWTFQLKSAGSNSYGLALTSSNETSIEYSKFKQNHKEILKKYPFKYQGNIEDNYPKYYEQTYNSYNKYSDINQINSSILANSNKQKTKQSFVIYDKNDGIEKETDRYKEIKKYFADNNQTVGNFNPNGQFLSYSTIENEVTRIDVLNINSHKSYSILKEKLPKGSYIESIKWIDNDSIFYRVQYLGYVFNRVVHLKIDESYKIISSSHLDIPINGNLVDALTTEDNNIYFANSLIYSNNKHGLYKIDTSSKRTIRKTTKSNYHKVKKFKNAVYWLTDSSSEIRFIITLDYNKKDDSVLLNYWFLPLGKKDWIKIKSYASIENIEVPAYISADDKYFYVLTDHYGDKSSIHKFSTEDFSHIGAYYENDDIEILGLNTDPSTHKVIGVTYVENGFHKIKYFENNESFIKILNKDNPNIQYYSVHHNSISQKVLLFGSTEYSKGAWYIYDITINKLYKLFDIDADYNKLAKGVFYHLNIKSKDGVNLEGYLVLPKDETKMNIPLIVMPHGGPIGIRDYAYSNDIQHFYASQGFATLKINYRGSGGFGKNFEKLGQQQWGEKIESDINEMVDYTLKNFNISQDKICSMGASYGGYSAVMLTILYPQRYKCAVSFAGVMDIPLMFTADYFKNDDDLFQEMSVIAGNPLVNNEELINKSPLYLAYKITKPILLFHGLHDKRVNLEHSLRMNEITKLMNLDTQLIILKNERHSLNNIESKVVYVARSLDFIKSILTK